MSDVSCAALNGFVVFELFTCSTLPAALGWCRALLPGVMCSRWQGCVDAALLAVEPWVNYQPL
jgi:hypothetical protein